MFLCFITVIDRAQYETETAIDTTVSDIRMDKASNTNTGQGRAVYVEECGCPNGYIGLSCEVGQPVVSWDCVNTRLCSVIELRTFFRNALLVTKGNRLDHGLEFVQRLNRVHVLQELTWTMQNADLAHVLEEIDSI